MGSGNGVKCPSFQPKFDHCWINIDYFWILSPLTLLECYSKSPRGWSLQSKQCALSDPLPYTTLQHSCCLDYGQYFQPERRHPHTHTHMLHPQGYRLQTMHTQPTSVLFLLQTYSPMSSTIWLLTHWESVSWGMRKGFHIPTRNKKIPLIIFPNVQCLKCLQYCVELCYLYCFIAHCP